jgi:RNA polymerase-binding transcription factor DksA
MRVSDSVRSGQIDVSLPAQQAKKADVSDLNNKYRKRLQKEIDEVERGLAELEDRLAEKGDYSLGEGDPSIYLWEMNLERRQRLQASLAELKKAMDRLKRGTYEECSTCGGRIEEGRLELVPTTRMCSRCARTAK